MEQENDIVRVYTGHRVQVVCLKDLLEENGISVIVRNDFQSGVAAGFMGGVPSAIDLYILESDLEKAKPIVDAFIEKEGDVQ